MKIIRKILKYLISVFITVVIVLYIFSLIFEKKISVIFIGELNKKLKTELVAGEVGFSLLKRFPRASIDLQNTLIKSPATDSGLDQSEYPDTLLHAKEVILTLRIIELLKKNYIIDRIDIENGIINFCKNSSGKYNTDILIEQEVSDTLSMRLTINNVNIRNSSFNYEDRSSGFRLASMISNSSNKLSIHHAHSNLRTKTSSIISEVYAGKGYHLTGRHSLKFNSDLRISKDSILIGETEMYIDGMDFTGNGNIDMESKQLSVLLTTGKAKIDAIAKLLPDVIRRFVDENNVTGIISSTMVLNGKTDRSAALTLNAGMDTENAELIMPASGIGLDKITASAILKIDFMKDNSIIEVSTDEIAASLDGSVISGSLYFRKDNRSYLDFNIRGLLPSASITEMINMDGLESSDGMVRVNARLWGNLEPTGDGRMNSLLKMNRSVNLNLNSINLKLPYLEEEIQNIQGNVMAGNNIWFDDLSMKFNTQNIALDGMITGFNKWLLKETNWLTVNAGLWSDRIDLKSFRKSIKGREANHTGRSTQIRLNLNLNSDSISSGNFRASLFDGSLTFVPGRISIPSFSMNTTGGSVSGNAAIASLGDEGYALRGWFDISNIDINKAFDIFNNFRQDYIKSENLEGNLTGNISISASANKEFIINKNDLAVSGDYSILNGMLIDFEPAYKLSNFIELDELERIEFSKLENELIINDQTITIPKMNISSSAFNISLEGNHSFSGVYEYHIKVLLSELLSRKKNTRLSEFGVIEDDGLGRTSIYLRLAGDKNGSRVYHDSEALRAGIKEDLIREKQTIKSILRDEYGIYRNDSIPETRTQNTRKFRIIWEETDSLKTGVDTTSEKKLPLIRLFRKKNKKEEPEK